MVWMTSENLWKIVSRDVKANLKQKTKQKKEKEEVKITGGCFINFYKKYLQNLKYNVERADIFYLLFT